MSMQDSFRPQSNQGVMCERTEECMCVTKIGMGVQLLHANPPAKRARTNHVTAVSVLEESQETFRHTLFKSLKECLPSEHHGGPHMRGVNTHIRKAGTPRILYSSSRKWSQSNTITFHCHFRALLARGGPGGAPHSCRNRRERESERKKVM